MSRRKDNNKKRGNREKKLKKYKKQTKKNILLSVICGKKKKRKQGKLNVTFYNFYKNFFIYIKKHSQIEKCVINDLAFLLGPNK